MRFRTIALAVTIGLTACQDTPTDPAPGLPTLNVLASALPSGSSLRLTARANAVSNSTTDPATVQDQDSDVQAGTTGPLSVSVNAVSSNGAGLLQASGGISAAWIDGNAGEVVWDVNWEAENLPVSSGGLLGVAAIGPGDGWVYTFTADVDGDFTLDFDIPIGGTNTFGLNPFNFLWLPPGASLPSQELMAQGTSGTVTRSLVAGEEYTVRITNNSGLSSTGAAISDRTASMTGTFEWRIVSHLTLVEIDIKPGSDANCFNNNGHGVIPVAILGNAGLDVTTIDPSTIQLESLSVRAVGRKGRLQAHIEDVNGDGFADLLVQIEDEDGVFTTGSGTATLTGAFYDGTPIQGSDAICVVPSA